MYLCCFKFKSGHIWNGSKVCTCVVCLDYEYIYKYTYFKKNIWTLYLYYRTNFHNTTVICIRIYQGAVCLLFNNMFVWSEVPCANTTWSGPGDIDAHYNAFLSLDNTNKMMIQTTIKDRKVSNIDNIIFYIYPMYKSFEHTTSL